MFIFPAGCALDKSVMLKREYVPGRISYIESQSELEQDISGLPMPPMKFQITQLYGLWETVDSAARGKTRIVLTYDRAARSVEAPMMGDVEFDTDDPDNEEAAPQLRTVLEPMIGMPVTMELGKDGEVVSFSGMDAINKKVSEKAVASMHWDHLKEEFTNERGKETWSTSPLLIYPNKKVKVGDTWNASISIERHMVGTIVTDYQYTVDRIDTENGRKTVSISATGLMSKGEDAKEDTDSKEQASIEEGEEGEDVEQKQAEQTGPEMELTGSLTGTALYDVESGRIVRRTTDSNVDIKIPLSTLIPNLPAGDEPQFAKFKTVIKITTLVLTEEERNAQKAEARKKAEMRKKAEEEDDDDEEDEEEEDE
jgi:hypothetical protein